MDADYLNLIDSWALFLGRIVGNYRKMVLSILEAIDNINISCSFAILFQAVNFFLRLLFDEAHKNIIWILGLFE